MKQQQGFSLSELLVALSLSSLLILTLSALLNSSVSSLNKLQQQRDMLSNGQQALAIFADNINRAGWRSKEGINWQLTQTTITSTAGITSAADNLSLQYLYDPANQKGARDCNGVSTIYTQGQLITNTLSLSNQQNGKQQQFLLNCRAYSKQVMVSGIANLRVRYGVDLGSYQAGGFNWQLRDHLPDVYLSADYAFKQPVNAIRIGLLSVAELAANQIAGDDLVVFGTPLKTLQSQQQAQLLFIRTYPLHTLSAP